MVVIAASFPNEAVNQPKYHPFSSSEEVETLREILQHIGYVRVYLRGSKPRWCHVTLDVLPELRTEEGRAAA